jgi:hypothetical protein
VRGARGGIGIALLWLLILAAAPGLRPATMAVQSMVQTVVVIGVSAWLIVGRPRVPPPVRPAAEGRITMLPGE